MIIEEAYTFDDVLLQPAHSTFGPGDANVNTFITKDISLNIPLLLAAMDTVTEHSLAITMAQLGGMGVLHKNLTIKEKDNIMLIAKKIIAYVNNGYWLSCSDFDDWDVLMENATLVASYGDIPTCLRAITLLNNDLKMDKKIEIIVSPRVRKLRDKKIALKKELNTKFSIRRAPPGRPFVVRFD